MRKTPNINKIKNHPGQFNQLHESVKVKNFYEVFADAGIDGEPLPSPFAGYNGFEFDPGDVTPENVNGNDGYKDVSPPKAPHIGPTAPKKGDPTPGGGW